MIADSHVLDHVAVAVLDWEVADRRWVDKLGGRWLAWYKTPAFRTRQYVYRGGGKLELLRPHEDDTDPSNFVRQFIHRYGSAVHHVTIKVKNLAHEVEQLDGRGYELVDVSLDDPDWKEAFLPPSTAGGVIVQLAQASWTDEELAKRRGFVPEDPPPDGARMHGVRLRHPNLHEAARLWGALGAEVSGTTSLVCSWSDSPLKVLVQDGSPAGPVSLLFSNSPDLPPEEGVGPKIEAVSGKL